jgi:hypothetical protein
MISYQELRRQILYDPESGLFTRIAQTERRNCRLGRTLGWSQKNGYLMITLGKKKYYAHRLAWFYVYGIWPKEIDHVNRDRTDNRFANLREVTRTQNNLNAKLNCRNKSGVKGVSWSLKERKWIARIQLNKKVKSLGSFDTVDEARKARKHAEEML